MDLEINLAGGAPPADDVPVLREQDGPELPANAVLNPDGGITLTFERPVTLTFRTAAGDTAKSEQHVSLVLRRLTGADMRKVLSAPGNKGTDVAPALSAGILPAKLALL